MKNMFSGMDNYTILSQITPDVYGYINSVVVVAKNGEEDVYRMPRRSEYVSAYSPIRDRMFMGLHLVYTKIIEMLKDKPVNNGGFGNYFLITVETGNDKVNKVISFDGYIIKADTPADLMTMKRFQAIPGINDKKLHSAIFFLNRQYEEDMKLIDVENTVFHMKAFRYKPSKIDRFKIEGGFDLDKEDCLKDIQGIFNGTNRSVYSMGLITEHTELFNGLDGYIEIAPEKKPVILPEAIEGAAKAADEAIATTEATTPATGEKREFRDLGVVKIDEVLKNNATTLHPRETTPTKTVEIETDD